MLLTGHKSCLVGIIDSCRDLSGRLVSSFFDRVTLSASSRIKIIAFEDVCIPAVLIDPMLLISVHTRRLRLGAKTNLNMDTMECYYRAVELSSTMGSGLTYE